MLLDKQTRLREILEAMKVPELRMDTTRLHNIRWLKRNLAIDRQGDPNLQEAQELIAWILSHNPTKGEPQ